jgi:hypothetical protein
VQYTVQTVDRVLRQGEHIPKMQNDIGHKSTLAVLRWTGRTSPPPTHPVLVGPVRGVGGAAQTPGQTQIYARGAHCTPGRTGTGDRGCCANSRTGTKLRSMCTHCTTNLISQTIKRCFMFRLHYIQALIHLFQVFISQLLVYFSKTIPFITLHT